ncbi:MAG: hypothetical protein KDI46_00065 [Alphaproteobacteria bacterium]|nr:hypothetical protein [Alphaproteobacteria bacterium]
MLELNEQTLHALGLPPMQARVYLAALELGQATLQAIARKSGVNRSTIYTFVEEMKERGYLLETKGGKRKIYSAVHPEQLLSFEKTRMAKLEAMMPELLAINNASAEKPRVTYHEGMQGIKDVYSDMIRSRQDIIAYEDLEHLKAGLPKEIFKWFPKARANAGVSIRTISRKSLTAQSFSIKNDALLREVKFVDAEDFKTDINVYGHKIALMDLRGDPPFCVLIENKHLADTLRSIWSLLWERLG